MSVPGDRTMSSAPAARHPEDATAPLIEAIDVWKVYGERGVPVEALAGVSLAIRRGELLVVLGPSGSGKSTLLHILGGMDRPTRGRVLFRGRDIATLDEESLTRFRREHAGFVFQFYNLVPNLTARENVELAAEIAPHPLAVEAVLEAVGLGDRGGHFPAELSGGEQQRVAIARAVAKNPEILFCDEPTGALDYETGVGILDLLDRMRHEYGVTVVVITHNAPIAMTAERVIRLRSGKIAEVRTNPAPKRPSEIEW
ncbi:MAG: ABC transporter ATP-binding protein [Planctomycetes bacterium]|nr:ABC transporter ATP-binding protein [Planctomycetota bacterium]